MSASAASAMLVSGPASSSACEPHASCSLSQFGLLFEGLHTDRENGDLAGLVGPQEVQQHIDLGARHDCKLESKTKDCAEKKREEKKAERTAGWWWSVKLPWGGGA